MLNFSKNLYLMESLMKRFYSWSGDSEYYSEGAGSLFTQWQLSSVGGSFMVQKKIGGA